MLSPLRLLAISFLSLRGRHEYKETRGRNSENGAFSSCRAAFALDAKRKASQDLDTVLRIQLEDRKKQAMKPSRKKYLQQKLGMDKSEVERLVHKSTNRVLEIRSEENVGPSIDWLQSRLGLDQKGVKKIVLTAPRVLTASTATLNSRITWLQERFNISENEIGKLVFKNPTLLVVSTQDRLEPNIKFLQSHVELDDKTIQNLVFKHEKITSKNYTEKILWLQQRLDLNTSKTLGTFLGRVDTVLNYGVENLDARICWFEQELCLPPDKVAKLILTFPKVLKYQSSVVTNKKNWLQVRLQLGDEEVGKLLSRNPYLLQYDMEANIEPSLSWLQSRLRLDDAGLVELVLRNASWLWSSIEKNLAPKIDFFVEVLGEEEAFIMLSKNPVALNLSLDKRIKPRVAEALELGIPLDSKSLATIVCYTKERWERKKLKFRNKQLSKL